MTKVKEPKKQVLKVEALRKGYFDGGRHKPVEEGGKPFVLSSVKEFSVKWMKPFFDVEEAKAYEAKLAAEAKAKADEEALKAAAEAKAEAEAPVVEVVEEKPATKKKATGDHKVI